ncbi:hypothetical protein E2C01_039139 [Portunus trituberculatus]|uniref:Uncharacterized protein n=1 Tax=Portunus trituberculatus TaxID=210409 RepID=A0A5B7FCV0_PORTR|nr:hypothetical protein [Portunus trituberculatus]
MQAVHSSESASVQYSFRSRESFVMCPDCLCLQMIFEFKRMFITPVIQTEDAKLPWFPYRESSDR